MKRYNYQTLLRQRTVVAALTLALLATMLGVGIELYYSTRKTTLPAGTAVLIQPLDPLLDLETVERLEQKKFLSLDEAKGGVQEGASQVAPLLDEEATSSGIVGI